ncbi:unnamed protein product [Schistocephalus solidus]|uniref:Uncharacterized protein n=1 Tax=Schistocephalus solidus TaxID=70667 RepID=A0A183TNT6_SCHSO|nr:unnamed protein product [Schistocephalus solidus]
MTTTTPATDNDFIDAPTPTITDTSSLPTRCSDHGDENHLPQSHHLSSHLRLPATCYLQHHNRFQYQR